MAAYRLSVSAEADLSNIIEYGIIRFGLTQVKQYVSELEQHLEALATNSSIGRDASELANGMRRFSFGSHVIFYLRDDSGVFVVRVLHQSRDFHRHL
jgi:toxin ParE1/3/4